MLLKENLTETKIELYKIEEKRQNHNNQEFIDKKIKISTNFVDIFNNYQVLIGNTNCVNVESSVDFINIGLTSPTK